MTVVGIADLPRLQAAYRANMERRILARQHPTLGLPVKVIVEPGKRVLLDACRVYYADGTVREFDVLAPSRHPEVNERWRRFHESK